MDRPITFYADIPLSDGTLHCRLTQRLVECHSKWNEPRHSTSDYEFHVVLSGAAQLQFDNGTTAILSRNSAILIAPHVFHRVLQQHSSIDRFFIQFSAEGDGLNRFLQQTVADYAVFSVGQDVLALVAELFREMSETGLYRRQIIENTLVLFVLKFLRSSGIYPDEYKSPADDSTMERKNIIDFYFSANMTQHGGEETLAKKLGLSSRQLLRLLQEYYGMSYREKLIHTRMDHALWMLRTTSASVGNIADAVGYSSEAAFRKVFRRHFGATPREMRNRFRTKP